MSSTRERLADALDTALADSEEIRQRYAELLDAYERANEVVKAARRAQPAIAQGQRAMQHLGWTHADVTAIAALSEALDGLAL